MNEFKVKLIVLIGVLFVSFSSIIIKSSTAPSLIIATYRMAFTVALMVIPFSIKEGKEIKKVNIKTISLCVLSGVFLAFHFAAWNSSIKYSSIASCTVLVDTQPIFVVIASFFILKEKINKRSLICILIALGGSIIISLGDTSLGSNAIYGDFLALIGAIFVSLYMIIGRIVRQKISTTIYTFIVYISSTVTLVLLCIFSKIPLYPYPMGEIFRFLLLAIFCTILGHSIFSWALKYIKPSFVSTSILGEPIFATIWALLFFNEIPKIWQIIGSILILVGIIGFIKLEKEV